MTVSVMNTIYHIAPKTEDGFAIVGNPHGKEAYVLTTCTTHEQAKEIINNPAALKAREVERKNRSVRLGAPSSREIRLGLALDEIDRKAEAGLCQFTIGGARAFLEDIRSIVKREA
jgi:hypothetical protein